MTSEIERYDGFARAREEIAKRLPDVFSFEIDYYYLERLDISTALARRAELVAFETEMREQGYTIAHSDNFARNCYVYSLKRVRKPAAAPKPKNALDDGSVIEVATTSAQPGEQQP